MQFYKIKVLFIFFIFLISISLQAQRFQPQQLDIYYTLTADSKEFKKIAIKWGASFGNDTLLVTMDWNEDENRSKVSLRALLPIYLHQIVLSAPYSTEGVDTRYFCNGFQSWTSSREYKADEHIPRLNRLLNPYSKNAGDYYFYQYPRKKGQLHSWSWTYWRDEAQYQILASLAENTGFTAFRFNTKERSLSIEKDCAGRLLLADKSFEVFDLLFLRASGYGAYKDFMDSYAQLWHQKYSSPNKGTAQSMIGWTSWYQYYTKIDEKIIDDNLEAFAKRSIPIDIFQIDDGYQQAVGDWLKTNKKFPKGMKLIADKIHENGYKAGIWLAPFVAAKNSETFKNHPDWFVKNKKGKHLRVARNVMWKGPYYALDIYHPEARAYIQLVLKTILEDWNFDLIKVDFLFAVCLQPRPGRTRGQIMHDAMLLLREAAGPDKLILGCGVPLAQSFGLVDYCRIGNDAHLGWEFKILKGLHAHERPSTISTLQNTIYRNVLSGTFFQNDPDVFILRDKKTKLNSNQKTTLFLLNQLLGELLFSSDYIADYTKAQMEQYLSAFPMRYAIITEIKPFDNNAYRISFLIGIREYIVYVNLDKNRLGINLKTGHSHYYEAKGNQLLALDGQKAIYLEPFESRCFYVVQGDDLELLGGEGHIFSGAEVDALEFDATDNLRVSVHPKTQLHKSIFFFVKDRTLQTVNINEMDYPVTDFGTYRGVEVKR